jgi:glycosyltransferase involved in cell wall biosynthesis
MKVVHINTSFGRGGAANLMSILSKNLASESGVENYHIVSYSTYKEEDFEIHIVEDKKCFWGQRKLQRILVENGFMDVLLPSQKYEMLKKISEIQPDIIHIHNTHGGYFEISLLKKLSKLAPVVWTFHDMFNLTGHCAYSFDCERWKTGCGGCPNIDISPAIRKDKTKSLLWYKRRVCRSSQFTIVTPSKWLYDCVKRSILKDKDVRLIYNGIETNTFKKTDKREAREKLSLPKDKKIILFSANGGIKNPFKGGEFVLDIYEKLKIRDDILFLNIGGEEKGVSDNWINYGYVRSEEEMALMYSAADIYLFPTLADNCPLTVIESMSCGLPVVTFDVGGVPEIVEHEKTGYIAKYKNSDDLLKGVEMLLDDEKMREEFGKAGEKRAREMFDAKIMAEKYYKLYLELLNKKL